MAVQFIPGQVAVSDPNPGGPSAISNIKSDALKVIKLTSANFSLANVDTLVAVLPADAMITSMNLWVKTQLAGGGITGATLSMGLTSGGTDFLNAVSAFAASSTFAALTPISGIFQNYNVPLGGDIRIFVRGGATIGTPTSGELYLSIRYVR